MCHTLACGIRGFSYRKNLQKTKKISFLAKVSTLKKSFWFWTFIQIKSTLILGTNLKNSFLAGHIVERKLHNKIAIFRQSDLPGHKTSKKSKRFEKIQSFEMSGPLEMVRAKQFLPCFSLLVWPLDIRSKVVFPSIPISNYILNSNFVFSVWKTLMLS